MPDIGLIPPLPTVFVASSGRTEPPEASDPYFGTLLRDLDLMTLVAAAEGDTDRVAVDIDSVFGLEADEVGARFIAQNLGIRIVVTRRPLIAGLFAEMGALGLIHVFAFDSTGLKRGLEDHPARPGVGTVVSPGPVLSHLTATYLERLRRPIVADGLVDTPERASRILEVADSVVVDPDCARAIASRRGNFSGRAPSS